MIGLLLISLGLVGVFGFAKPYLYYLFGPQILESRHELGKSGDRIFIPGIKLEAPLYEDGTRLSHGIIIRYQPGKNNTVVRGHNFAEHGPMFSLLYLVQPDDEVILHFRRRRYVYRIKTKRIVNPAEAEGFYNETKDKRLTLTTCYPPASNAMRLIVIAKPMV